jgi:uncharacterized protein YrzB (UPF0473 family)
MEQEVNNKITLDYEDGSTVECEILGVFEAIGKEYIALYCEETDDIILYRYVEIDEQNFELEDIPEEDFDAVSEVFESFVEEEEE